MTKKNHQRTLNGQTTPLYIFVIVAVLLLVATTLFTALFSYHTSDPAWSHNIGGEIQNSLGVVGAWYSDLSFSILGKMGYLLPITFVAFAVQIWLNKSIDKELFSWRLFMLLTAILSGSVLFTKHDTVAINEVSITGGGALGAWLTIGLEKSVKSVSVIMAFSTIIFVTSLSLLLNIPWIKIAESIGTAIIRFFQGFFTGRKTDSTRSESKKNRFGSSNLQEKIQRINSLVGKEKKTDEPKFSIDRYDPEEEYESEISNIPTPNTNINDFDEADYRNPFENNESQQSFSTLTTLNREQEIPLSSSLVSSEEKAEPNFFDFGDIRPEKTTHDLPNDTHTRNHFSVEETPVNPVNFSSETHSTIHSEHESIEQAEDEPDNKNTYTSSWTRPETTSTEKSQSLPEINYATQVEQPTTSYSDYQPIFEPLISIFDDVNGEKSTIEADDELVRAIQATPVVSSPRQTTEVYQTAVPTAPIVVQQLAQPVQPLQQQAPSPLASESFIQQSQNSTTLAANGAAAVVAATATAAFSNGNKVSIGKAYDSRADDGQAVEPVKKMHTLPSIDLLDNPPAQINAYTEDALAEMAEVLERTLQQFNVKATVMHVSPGPVITRFEIDLAPGIQAKKISGLSVDLARALAVSGVRVEEVIPGSSYVGLEVPNKQRQIVYFKDIVRSSAFQSSKSPLTVSLGSDTSGKPVVANLMKMPHALVAGTTGSGKSVCVNVMLLSMLYKSTPKELRLILIDPKMLEMSMYEDIPHLLTPVITDMKEAENALTWVVGEMERRYQLMAALKVRKIDAYNQEVDDAAARGETIKDPLWNPDDSVGYTHQPDLERLPFIVVVIDELADMMMVVGKQVEQLIARLTQKARAAGIHVVLATQRPSTDVLTGLIKANVPTRIAFQVSSSIDSRVIIDSNGAEKLLGHGDMLYVPPGAGHPQRLHGAFVDDAETDRITDFLRSMGEPDYINGITGKQNPENLGAFGAAEAAEAKEDADPLYEEAVNIVLTTGKASISSVQRQLRIGYNRAARMIEDMQEQGIVSEPANGIRKVLSAPLRD